MVMELRFGDRGGREIDTLLDDVGIAIVPFDQAQAKLRGKRFVASARAGIGPH